jgi:type IV secretory pathway TrbD component
MLSALIAPIISTLLGQLTDLGKRYIDKQITEVEYKRQTELAITEANRAIELAQVEAQRAMFTEVQQSVRSTPVVGRAFAAVIMLAMVVWIFGTLGVGLWQVVTGTPFPAFDPMWAVGSATGLVMFCLGAGSFRR